VYVQIRSSKKGGEEMIKLYNGAIWKISMTKNFIRVERFAQGEHADFPYSVVECDPCKIIADPTYDPTGMSDNKGRVDNHKRAGQITFSVNSVLDLWKMIIERT
jgi:hypothetical protein